jgi:hypothetical protein
MSNLPDPKLGMSFEELRAFFETPEGKRLAVAEEGQFRKGYWFGWLECIEALENGATVQDLIDHYNGPVWNWRYGDPSKIVEPPGFKTKGE